MKPIKIMDRIKKLLAMGNDASSPEEAAIAAKRARSMMDKHQISELDLSGLDEDEFGELRHYTQLKRPHASIGMIAASVSKLNDCVVTYSFDYSQKSVLFKGFKQDVVLSIEMLKYLIGQCNHLAKLNASGRADINSYRLGFASGFAKKVREIMEERKEVVTTDSKQLVVVKKALVEAQYGIQKYSKKKSYRSGSNESYNNGRVAGYNANINKQITA